MLTTTFLFLSVFSLHVISSQVVAIQSPKIIKENGHIILVLPEKMKMAISKFNPDFAVRRVEDYSPSIAKITHDKGPRVAPFAVIVDVNRDGVLDVILEGHDKQKDLLIGVVSQKGNYRVVSINDYELSVPKTTRNFFEGKVEFGLKSCIGGGAMEDV